VCRWVEHTGELELEIEAQTEEAVYREALAAMAELLGDDGESERYDVSSYRAALAAHPGRVQRLRGEAPAPGADADLIATMRRCAGSLQEEAVLDELIEDLAARRSCGLTARGR
jgi:hypothetical protein